MAIAPIHHRQRQLGDYRFGRTQENAFGPRCRALRRGQRLFQEFDRGDRQLEVRRMNAARASRHSLGRANNNWVTRNPGPSRVRTIDTPIRVRSRLTYSRGGSMRQYFGSRHPFCFLSAQRLQLSGDVSRSILGRTVRKYRPEDHYMRGPGPKWREKHFLTAHPPAARGFAEQSILRIPCHHGLRAFPFRLNGRDSISCFDAFSSREPVSTSLENAQCAWLSREESPLH